MPRNGSGTFSLPEAAFVPGTVILSSAVNNDFSDIATALTGSLSRDGQGGMTDTLPLALTGFNYLADINTGMRRTAADTQAIECGGVDIAEFTTTGASVDGDFAATGVIKQGGFNLLPVGLGPIPWSGSAAPAGWVLAYGQALSRTTYAALWAFAQAEIALGNTLYTDGNGTTTFTVPDMRGNLPYGRDNMGGSSANRITSTYYGGNPNTIGSPGGSQTKTLAQDNLPNATLSVSGSFSGTTSSLLVNSGFTGQIQSGGATRQLGDIATASVSGSITGTTASINGGVSQTAFGILPAGVIANYIIFAGV